MQIGNSTTPTEPSSFQEQWDVISDHGKRGSAILLRGMGISVLFLGSMMLLGVGFFLLGQAVFLTVIWFAPYWQPAYSLLVRITNIPEAPRKLIPLAIPPYRYILLLIKAGLILTMFYYGIQMFIQFGFIGQNIIYMALVSQ